MTLNSKTLIVCGPTSVGKTTLALKLASKFNGELISADSRQVYKGMDILTGKDIPTGFNKVDSLLTFEDKKINYYSNGKIRIWLYDIVNPDEQFNISLWKNLAEIVITDIHFRRKLPIIVGGSGLYLRSISENIETISIPPNPELRKSLQTKSIAQLQDILRGISRERMITMNSSDLNNPRRLIRAIEVSNQKPNLEYLNNKLRRGFLKIGLTAPKEELEKRIHERVRQRITLGAGKEAAKLLRSGLDLNLPAMTATGIMEWRSYLQSPKASQAESPMHLLTNRWEKSEKSYLRRQITWFKKDPNINWFDTTQESWEENAENLIRNWYNGN